MKKNFLFILPGLPYPLKSGGHQAMFNSIASIYNDYHVYLAYDTWAADNNIMDLEKEFSALFPDIHLLPHRPVSRCSLFEKITRGVLVRAKSLYRKHERPDGNDELCRKWIESLYPRTDEWLGHIDRICKTYHFDIIQVEMSWMMSQILTLPKGPKTVFVHHELGFVRRELEQKLSNSNYYMEACKSYADLVEISLLNRYDTVITLSSDDAQKLKDKGVNVPVCPSFSIVNTKEFDPAIGDGETLSFVGADSHAPNLVGVMWFLENCWGRLKSINSGYKLNIIGLWNEKNRREIMDKFHDVHFLGFVDDLSDGLKGTIMIVPITIGSGIRMKILEACSMGVPFVSTTVGAEGLQVVDGEHCFIADSPNDFVDKIVRLKEKSLQTKFVDNSNALIKNHFSLESLKKNRLSIYHQLNQS